jgi:uncharacterized protein YndB with AHSA1/START domain
MASQTAAKSVPKVIIKKVIKAKRENVFDAWTKPELMQKWFFPANATNASAVTKNELRVGGSYHHEMRMQGSDSDCSHDAKPDADGVTKYPHSGEYLEIDPPRLIVFTWNSPSVKDTRVSVELRDLGDSTEVTLTHELLATEDDRQNHTNGWDGCLASLEAFVTE